MKLHVTMHAVHRYIERIDPQATYEQARRRMMDLFESATRLRERTRDGCAYYLSEDVKLVVREERSTRVIITVVDNRIGIPSLNAEIEEAWFAKPVAELTEPANKQEERIKTLQQQLETQRASLNSLQQAYNKLVVSYKSVLTPPPETVRKSKHERILAHNDRLQKQNEVYKDLLRLMIPELVRLANQDLRAQYLVEMLQKREPGLLNAPFLERRKEKKGIKNA